MLAHWQNYNSAAYGSIPGNDCVNVASRSLIARGWTMEAGWSFGAGGYSTAWASSTAFADYLSAHPERAVPLTATNAPRCGSATSSSSTGTTPATKTTPES